MKTNHLAFVWIKSRARPLLVRQSTLIFLAESGDFFVALLDGLLLPLE